MSVNSFHEFGSAATEAARRFAIVGAGPAGLYVAQALRQAEPGAEIDVIERLPSPYGLVRYGVAPDHQGAKAVIRQFERLFERQGVGFFGGVTVGRDVDLDELAGLYDAVILAAGLAGERRGEDLPGVIGAGAATAGSTAIPEHPEDCPPFGPRVAIIGAGNVAMDLARLLAKPAEAYRGSDFDPVRTAAPGRARRAPDRRGRPLRPAGRPVRSPAGQGDRQAARRAHRGSAGRWMRARPSTRDALARLAVPARARRDGPADADRILTFRFGRAPERILGEDRVKAVVYIAADGSRETRPGRLRDHRHRLRPRRRRGAAAPAGGRGAADHAPAGPVRRRLVPLRRARHDRRQPRRRPRRGAGGGRDRRPRRPAGQGGAETPARPAPPPVVDFDALAAHPGAGARRRGRRAGADQGPHRPPT
ncbi:MAG: FAD-dependent oxidoreductase [Caulobacteraceae bacterium]